MLTVSLIVTVCLTALWLFVVCLWLSLIAVASVTVLAATLWVIVQQDGLQGEETQDGEHESALRSA